MRETDPVMRSIARALDEIDAAIEELDFIAWQRDTVFGQAVERWVEEVGRG